MNKLVILLFLLAAVLFTAGCTEEDDTRETQIESVVTNITSLEQINTSILEGPVFLKFGTQRCTYCKDMDPILRDLAAKYEGRATVMSIDVDQSPLLGVYFNIKYVPDSSVIVGIENGNYVYMQMDGNVTTDRFNNAIVSGLQDSRVYKELMARAVIYYENAK